MRQLYQQARCCRCSCLRECSGYTQVGQCDSDLPVIAATGGEPMTTMVEPGPQNTVVGAGPQNTVVGAGPQNTIVERQPEISSVGVQTSPQSSLRRSVPRWKHRDCETPRPNYKVRKVRRRGGRGGLNLVKSVCL